MGIPAVCVLEGSDWCPTRFRRHVLNEVMTVVSHLLWLESRSAALNGRALIVEFKELNGVPS